MKREELHDLIHGAARILRKQVSTRSDTDALTRLEKLLVTEGDDDKREDNDGSAAGSS